MSRYEYDEEKHLKGEREFAYEQGIEQGIERGLRVFIPDNLTEGVSTEKIIDKLMTHFELSEVAAAKYPEKYGRQQVSY